MAKLIAAGRFKAIIDTCYDLLLRRACEIVGAPHRFSQLDRGLHLATEGLPLYLAIHGTWDDWTSAVLTGESYAMYDERHPLAIHELELLLRARDAGHAIVEVPISTVYLDGNSSSHFRPVRDSARVYAPLVRFAASSGLAAAIDYVLLFVLHALTGSLALSVVGARVTSASVNYATNRRLVFRRGGPSSAPRYSGAAPTANVGILSRKKFSPWSL